MTPHTLSTGVRYGMETGPRSLSLRFDAALDTIEGILALSLEWGSAHGLNADDKAVVRLLLEELLTNIHFHAAPETPPEQPPAVFLRLELPPPDGKEEGGTGGEKDAHPDARPAAVPPASERLRITLHDTGKPFDPFRHDPMPLGTLDTTAPGGQGLSLVRLFATECRYRRTADVNQVSLELALRTSDQREAARAARSSGAPGEKTRQGGLRNPWRAWRQSLAFRQTVLFSLCALALFWGGMGAYYATVAAFREDNAELLALHSMATQEELSRAFLKRVEGGVAAFAARLGAHPAARALYADGRVLGAVLQREEALRHFRTETPVLGFVLGQAGRDGVWYYSLRDGNGGAAWLPSIPAAMGPFGADGKTPASGRWHGPIFHIPDPGVGRHAALLFGLPVAVSDGGPPLWIGAVLGMPWIENTLRGLSGFARSEPFFCNSDGDYVIYPPGRAAGQGPQTIFADAAQNGLPALETLGKEMLAGEKIVTKLEDGLETAQGQPVWPLPWQEGGTVAVYPMSIPGWHLGMIIPDSAIGNGPLRLPGWLVLFAFLAPFLTGAVTWSVTTRTTAPLRALADALENLGRGDLDTPFPAPETSDEAGMMLRSFEKARVILKASFRSLAHNAARQQSLRDELALARAIQESMLPTVFPEMPSAAVHGRLVMAREVCGDLYDCFRPDEGRPSRLALVIGDVCGKGIPAALIMSRAMSLARSFLMRGYPPALALEKVNAALLRKDNSTMFVTMLIGLYDADDGRFTWASAGHPPPMRGPAPDSPRIGGDPARGGALPWSEELVLGVAPDRRYTTFSVGLEPGQALLLYTDGAEDAMGPREGRNAVPFGEEELARSFDGACVGTAREADGENAAASIVRRVADDLDAHMAGAPPYDDISFLVLRRNGFSGGIT